MINQKLLDEPVFSFRVGSSEDDGGEAIFGGIDETAFSGKLHYVPVRRKAYWEVELQKISLGDDELEMENTGAAIDTGTYRWDVCGIPVAKTNARHLPDCPSHRYCRDD